MVASPVRRGSAYAETNGMGRRPGIGVAPLPGTFTREGRAPALWARLSARPLRAGNRPCAAGFTGSDRRHFGESGGTALPSGPDAAATPRCRSRKPGLRRGWESGDAQKGEVLSGPCAVAGRIFRRRRGWGEETYYRCIAGQAGPIRAFSASRIFRTGTARHAIENPAPCACRALRSLDNKRRKVERVCMYCLAQ
jgi:hypothetical protein